MTVSITAAVLPLSAKDQHIRAMFLEATLDLRAAHLAGKPTDKFGAVTEAIAAASPDVIERAVSEASK